MAIDLAGRIDAAVAAATGGADEGGPSEGGTAAAIPSGGSSGGDAGTTAPTTLDAAAAQIVLPNEAAAAEARRAEIQAKLAQQNERRKANQLARAAEADRKAAAQDREAARGDRTKWEALRQGSFKEGIAALGLDPGKVFQEMQREAIEASTPEAEIKRMRADFERQIGEKLTPLQQTIEELKAEKAEATKRAQHMQLTSAFTHEVQDPAFISLRTEYDDADLFGYVDNFVKNPDAFEAAAKVYGVPLTDPEDGFTMREILSVLKAAQDAHDQGRQRRAAKFAPAAPSAPSKTPTVNGTAERRNAGATIGSDLAGERAAPPPTMTRQQRVQAEIDRLSRR